MGSYNTKVTKMHVSPLRRSSSYCSYLRILFLQVNYYFISYCPNYSLLFLPNTHPYFIIIKSLQDEFLYFKISTLQTIKGLQNEGWIYSIEKRKTQCYVSLKSKFLLSSNEKFWSSCSQQKTVFFLCFCIFLMLQ